MWTKWFRCVPAFTQVVVDNVCFKPRQGRVPTAERSGNLWICNDKNVKILRGIFLRPSTPGDVPNESSVFPPTDRYKPIYFQGMNGRDFRPNATRIKEAGGKSHCVKQRQHQHRPQDVFEKERGGVSWRWMENERERVTLSKVVKVCLRNHVQGQEQAEGADGRPFSCRLVIMKLIRVSLNSITLEIFNFLSNENQIKIIFYFYIGRIIDTSGL